MGAPAVPASFKAELRAAFNGVFIGSGGLDRSKAEQLLTSGDADLVAFGRPALANPDLVARLQDNASLNPPDFSTFYTPARRATPTIQCSYLLESANGGRPPLHSVSGLARQQRARAAWAVAVTAARGVPRLTR